MGTENEDKHKKMKFICPLLALGLVSGITK